MELEKKVETILICAILYNMIVYIPYNNIEGPIPKNSIIYHNKIYIEYIDNNIKQESQDNNEISRHKSKEEILQENDNLLKKKSSIKRKSKRENKKKISKRRRII